MFVVSCGSTVQSDLILEVCKKLNQQGKMALLRTHVRGGTVSIDALRRAAQNEALRVEFLFLHAPGATLSPVGEVDAGLFTHADVTSRAWQACGKTHRVYLPNALEPKGVSPKALADLLLALSGFRVGGTYASVQLHEVEQERTSA